MKKIALKIALILSSGIILSACQNTNPPHGEEGHQCTEECKTMQKSSSQTTLPSDATGATKTELREHECREACKNGHHVFAHGEKEHVCTDECLKNNNP